MARDSSTARGTDLDAGHVAAILAGAILLALYATWVTADLLARWLVFPLVALAAGYALSRRPTTRGKAIYLCTVLAGLLVLTPVFVLLPDVLSVGEYGVSPSSMVFTAGALFLVILYGIPAAIVGYVGYRIAGGRGVLTRVRDARSG